MRGETLDSFIYGFSIYREKIVLFSAVMAFLAFLLIGYFIIYNVFNLFIHNPLVQTGLYVYSYSVTAASVLFIVILLIIMYFVNLSLNSQRKFDGTAKLGSILRISNRTYLNFFALSSAQLIISAAGMVLLIIPGFYLGTKLLFLGVSSIYYDDNLFSAFRRTMSVTKGDNVSSFLLFLLYFIISAVLIYFAMIVSSSVFISYIIYSFIASFILISFFSSTYRLLSSISNKKSRLDELIPRYTGN
ncbi:MAG: hypothetical protein OH316_00790 [Candidatus Parvarchaeota archaeon]|nr:hypothetical protein [Candidatus Parvarchaeota archaeon]